MYRKVFNMTTIINNDICIRQPHSVVDSGFVLVIKCNNIGVSRDIFRN